jgi:hypothetical protein
MQSEGPALCRPFGVRWLLCGDEGPVRVVFITYLLVIVAGLTYFTVIGLTHH